MWIVVGAIVGAIVAGPLAWGIFVLTSGETRGHFGALVVVFYIYAGIVLGANAGALISSIIYKIARRAALIRTRQVRRK